MCDITFRGEELEAFIKYRTVDQRVCIACGSKANSEWAKQGSYRAIKCNNCGLVWVNPHLNEEGLNKYYTGFINKRRLSNQKKMDQRSIQYKQDVEFIENYINRGKVLDVGCSGGFLLDSFSSDFEKYGIEVDKESVRYAKKHAFQNGKINIECNNIYNMTFCHEFDLVIMRGTIEHAPSPVSSIEKVSNILKKGGYFYIAATPNVECFSADFYRDKWSVFHPVQHLWYFSPYTLNLICERFGLRLISQYFPYINTPYENAYEDIKRIANDIKLKEDDMNNDLSVSPAFWGNIMNLVFVKD